MSHKIAADSIKKFASLVESREIIKKQNEIVKHITGPISNTRDKLRTIESDEAVKILAETELPLQFGESIRNSILDIFDEEVSDASKLLKEVDTTLHNLQDLLDVILHHISNERNQLVANSSNKLILDCYEHCRSILIFFKLKNKILKHYLLAPPDMSLNPDPFSQVPNFLAEEENVIYLLCKIEYANFNWC